MSWASGILYYYCEFKMWRISCAFHGIDFMGQVVQTITIGETKVFIFGWNFTKNQPKEKVGTTSTNEQKN
jgi:hypothetical protein